VVARFGFDNERGDAGPAFLRGEGDFAHAAGRVIHPAPRSSERGSVFIPVGHSGVLRDREMIYGGAPNNLHGLAGLVGGAFGVNFWMTNSCRRFATAPLAMPIAPFSKVNPAPLRS